MELSQVLAVVIAAAVAWFVWDGLKVREAANDALRAACTAEGLQFLDDTVALSSIWPARDDDGRVRLRRVYAFEYSDTGHNRRKGSVTLIGDAVLVLDIGVRGIASGMTLH